MTHPLLQCLAEQGIPELDLAGIDAWLPSHSLSVLLFAGNPQRFPEALDVAVILPELLKVFPSLSAVRVAKASEPEGQARYRFNVWPSLVFLRDGQYLGSISRVLNWQDYCQEIAAILSRSPDPFQTQRLDGDSMINGHAP